METQNSHTKTYIDNSLLESSPEELMALFKTLKEPKLEEMHGEFNAIMLTQNNTFLDIVWRVLIYTPFWPGTWAGKAFRPVDESSGRGYNLFRVGAKKIVQRFPMKTLIAPSRYDSRPAYQLIYRAYHSACAMVKMVDEVRILGNGKYLLIGTAGFTRKQRHIASFFLLDGPVRPYRADIGKPRKKYDLAEEIPNLNAGKNGKI